MSTSDITYNLQYWFPDQGINGLMGSQMATDGVLLKTIQRSDTHSSAIPPAYRTASLVVIPPGAGMKRNGYGWSNR